MICLRRRTEALIGFPQLGRPSHYPKFLRIRKNNEITVSRFIRKH
jgi:hypothetical protein